MSAPLTRRLCALLGAIALLPACSDDIAPIPADSSVAADAGRDLGRADSRADLSPADAPTPDATTNDLSPGPDLPLAADQTLTPDLAPPDLPTPLDQAPRLDSSPAPDLPLPLDAALPDQAPAPDLTAADLPQGPDPGPVQCRDDAECGAGLFCTLTAPGGICAGCGSSCPDFLLCLFGSCVRECQSDADCNVGMYCADTLRCLIRSCDATSPCPAPYSCGDDNRCRRPACGPAISCPAPLYCGPDNLCLEPL